MRKLILAMFVLFLLLAGTIVDAEEVVLTWESSIDDPYLQETRGYQIYMSETKGVYVLITENPDTNNQIGEVGRGVLTFTLTVPDEPCRRWFVVTALDTRELESVKSNEVCYNSFPAPAPPSNLQGSPSVCHADLDRNGSVDGIDAVLAIRAFSEEFGRTDCSGEK